MVVPLAADAMPCALIDADQLTEAADELLALARQLNPGGSAEEHLDLAMAALGALIPQSPDAWLAMAVERVLERQGQRNRPTAPQWSVTSCCTASQNTPVPDHRVEKAPCTR